MRYHRSLFWPFVFIATGIVWLLVEFHTIPVDNLWALMYVWPFVLMVVGVGLILRSRWNLVHGIISGLTVLGMVAAIIFAPQLGWNRPANWSFINFDGSYGSISGSGKIVSQARQVTDFTSVEVTLPVDLTITQGNSTSLTVEADDNLMPQLSTRVAGSTLYIENSERDHFKRVNPSRPVKIHMTVKDLHKVDFSSSGSLSVNSLQTTDLSISVSGAGTVNLANLTAKSLNVDLSGTGTIEASGSVSEVGADISGLGGFRGGDLAAQSARISISGAGNATTWVKNSLNVEISGTGSVSYYGSPSSITKDISGLGNVSSLGNK